MDIPNLLLQKFPAPAFTLTTQLNFNPARIGEQAGLVILGNNYSGIAVVKRVDGVHLIRTVRTNADQGTPEREEVEVSLSENSIRLRITVDTGAICRFSYSDDNKTFKHIGEDFIAREGHWIGARIGIFSLAPKGNLNNGFIDFDWFRFE